ncbi:MAG: MFS transporter [Legionellaceae bacterium]
MEMIDTMNRMERLKLVMQPWLICFAASLFFFYEFIQGNMFASIADYIMRDFHIHADKMVLLSSAYYISNVIFLFAAGVMLDRFSAKKIIVIAMFFCIVSTFVLAYTSSFGVALSCRLMIGVGSAFCFLGPIRIATRWFPPKKMALVTGAIVTMAMSGGLLAQYPLMQLVLHVGWREALLDVSWLGVLMLVLMIAWIQDEPEPKEKPAVAVKKTSLLLTARQAYFNSQTFMAGMYASLMNMAVAVLGAVMGQLYLVQRLGVPQSEAAAVNGMLFLGAMVGGPLVGWASDRIGLRILPMKLGAFFSFAIILGILYAPASFILMCVLFFLLGISTATQVISYPLVAESSSPTMVALAVSFVSVLLQGGYIVYQNLFSLLLLSQGVVHMIHGVPVYSLEAYQVATLILPVSFFIAFIATFKLKETACHQQHP